MSDNTAARAEQERQTRENAEKARKDMEKASGKDADTDRNNQERDKRPYNKEADG